MIKLTIQTQDQLKRNIKTGAITPVYFLFGNDPYLIDHYTDLIVKKSVTSLPDINLKIYDSDFDVSDIYNIAYQVPMMSDKRAIILSNFDLTHVSKNDFESLLSIASEPSDVSVIIFKYTSIELSFKSNSRIHSNYKKIVEVLSENGSTVAEVNHLTLGDTIKTIVLGAKRRKCLMLPQTAKYLIEYCSHDLKVLLAELEKLCAYVGEGEITNEIIDKICVKSISSVIYDLSKAVLSNKPKESLKILDQLLIKRVKATEILSELSKTYINIFRMKSARMTNIDKKEVTEDFKYGSRSFLLDIALPYANKMSAEQVNDSLNVLSITDNHLRGGSRLKEKEILEMLIINLIKISSGGRPIC